MNIKHFALITSVFALSMSANAIASVVLDQDNNPATDFGAFLEDLSGVYGDNAWQTQTFTVGVDGFLDHIDVLLGAADPTAGSFSFELRSTSVGGDPDLVSAPLATAVASFDLTSSSYTFASIDFRAANIAVSVGDVLALSGLSGSGVFTAGNPAANWVGSTSNPYAGGAYYVAFFDDPATFLAGAADGYDLNFRSYVDTTVVPVPAAVWLFGSGLLGLVGVARRKS